MCQVSGAADQRSAPHVRGSFAASVAKRQPKVGGQSDEKIDTFYRLHRVDAKRQRC